MPVVVVTVLVPVAGVVHVAVPRRGGQVGWMVRKQQD
jgi:hypothetical protein